MIRPRTAKRGRFKWILLSLVLILAVIIYRALFAHPAFDPDKVARAETEMWKAYYAGNQTKLAVELMTLFRNEYGLSLTEAGRIGKLYAQAAIKFQPAQGNYDQTVLPDLIQAYAELKRDSNAGYDAEAAARAELAWWVARRTPGQNSAEQVGEKITALYVLLYGRNDPSLQSSGLLRARAATLRDAGGQEPDWAQVEDLLRQSYRALQEVRRAPTPAPH
jgi:hypothetical protein